MVRIAVIKKGDEFDSNFSGPVIVVHYFDYKNISIEFLVTGRMKTVNGQALTSGSVRDKNTAEIIVKRVKLMAENKEFTPNSPKAVFIRTQLAWKNQGDL